MGKRLPVLTEEGLCSKCHTWHELNELGSIPGHHVEEEGVRAACKGSGYSAMGHRYRIETDEEARELAEFILKDRSDSCFSNLHHSMACGDGRNCAVTRLLLAKALAEYVLSKDQ